MQFPFAAHERKRRGAQKNIDEAERQQRGMEDVVGMDAVDHVFDAQIGDAVKEEGGSQPLHAAQPDASVFPVDDECRKRGEDDPRDLHPVVAFPEKKRRDDSQQHNAKCHHGGNSCRFDMLFRTEKEKLPENGPSGAQQKRQDERRAGQSLCIPQERQQKKADSPHENLCIEQEIP